MFADSLRPAWRRRLVLTLALLVTVVGGIGVTQRLRESARLDFESGDLSGWRQLGWQRKFAAPHAARVVSNPARRGRYAVRFELRHGDDTGDGVRAELKETYHAPLGREIWYSLSTLIPEDFPVLDRPVVITQWHAEEDPGEDVAARSPVLAHRYDGKTFLIDIRWSTVALQQSNDGASKALYVAGDVAKGVWHDFVYRIRWSCRPDGAIQAWMDGQRVIDYNGPVGYNDARGPYFKFGIYHHFGSSPLVIYHDEYRRGFIAENVDRVQ